MNKKIILSRLSLLAGSLAIIILIGFFLALTDIWHEAGRPDIWSEQVNSTLEWRFLSIAFWPLLGLVLGLTAIAFYASWRSQ